jgi:hypothetical protein
MYTTVYSQLIKSLNQHFHACLYTDAGRHPAHTFLDDNARRSSRCLRVPELPTLLEALPKPGIQPGNPSRQQAAIAAEFLSTCRAWVKTFKLNLSTCSKDDIRPPRRLWLRACFAAKPGVADLALLLPDCYASEYSFS